MTDRELLEAAAKAAGYNVRAVAGYEEGGTVSFYMEPSQLWWNPLIDDGDALRLAVKLGISVDFAQWVQTAFYGVDQFVQEEWHNADPYAATRRAIVRAAAAMAKEPKP